MLIDLTPEALIERLRAGKVYPGQNIEAALNNFFRIENLAALREVALRQVAEEVESKRLVVEQDAGRRTREERVEADAPKAVGERLLALVRPRRSSQRLVRRAWRSAQRLGTDLDLLWVKRPQERMSERKENAARPRCASSPRCSAPTLLIEESDDVVEATAEVVRAPRHHLHLRRRVAAAARAGAAARAAAPAADASDAPPASTCGSSPTGEIGARGRAGGGSDVSPIEAVLIAVGLAVAGGGGFLIARRRLGRPAAPTQVPPDPAAVHRPGDLAPRARRRAAPREGRGRHPDARLPGDRPDAPSARCSPCPEAASKSDAAARGDRAAGAPPRASRSTLESSVGRSYRHALAAPAGERDGRPRGRPGHRHAGGSDSPGDDLVWLLQKAPAEVLILRPGPEDTRVISANNGNRPNGAVRNGATRPPGVRRQP